MFKTLAIIFLYVLLFLKVFVCWKFSSDPSLLFAQYSLIFQNRFRWNHMPFYANKLNLNKELNEDARQCAKNSLPGKPACANLTREDASFYTIQRTCGNETIKQLAEKMATKFYKENENYTYDHPTKNPKTDRFVQLVWQKTKAFGAGFHSDGGTCFMVAIYYPRAGGVEEYKENVLRPTVKIPKSELNNTCNLFSSNACACSDNECQFDFQTSSCLEKLHENDKFCRVTGVRYAVSPNHFCTRSKFINCATTAQLVYGVNFNGLDHVDSFGRRYQSEEGMNSLWDPKHIRDAGVISSYQCELELEIENHQERLYSNYIFGSKSKQTPGTCLSYPIAVHQGGEYELTIKSLSGVHGRTCFNIKIGNVLVAEDIDLQAFSQNDQCKPIELSFLLEIDNGMRILKLIDSNIVILMHKGFHIFFCYGSCNNTDVSNSFYISGMSLVRVGNDTFIPKEMDTSAIGYDARCNHMSRRPCECEFDGCTYNYSTKKCFRATQKTGTDKQVKTTCHRKGIYYALSPSLHCLARMSTGDCQLGTVTYAVNLGGGVHTDVNGITFIPETSTMGKGPSGLRTSQSLFSKCSVTNAEEEDGLNLYGTFVYGNTKVGKRGACLNYTLPIIQDGSYEIVLKSVEGYHEEQKKRLFDIKLNGEEVASSIDLVKLGEGEKCVAIDISIQFEIEGSGKFLRTHYGKYLKNKNTTIGFCLSETEAVDIAFQVSAFYLVRYGNDTKIPTEYIPERVVEKIPTEKPPTRKPKPPTEKPTKKPMPSTEKTTERTPTEITTTKSIEPIHCHDYHTRAITCRKSGCEYDIVENKCLPEMKDCEDNFFTDYTTCRRFSTGLINSTAIYASAGVFCVNRKNQNDKCSGALQMYGVNFGGLMFEYFARSTIYYEDNYKSSYDPEGIRVEAMVVNKAACTLAKINDRYFKTMMGPIVTANMRKVNKNRHQACVPYYFKVCGDGVYELSLWVLEGTSDAPNQRCFDIKMGYTTVLKSIDPYKIAGRQCARLELIVLFKVQNNNKEIVPKGFTKPIQIENNEKVPLHLCTGTCGAQDESFQLSAASVHRLSRTSWSEDAC